MGIRSRLHPPQVDQREGAFRFQNNPQPENLPQAAVDCAIAWNLKRWTFDHSEFWVYFFPSTVRIVCISTALFARNATRQLDSVTTTSVCSVISGTALNFPRPSHDRGVDKTVGRDACIRSRTHPICSAVCQGKIRSPSPLHVEILVLEM